MGSVGSFTRVTVAGSAYARYAHGSVGSYNRIPLVNVNIVGVAPALVKTLNGTATQNPLSLTVDGSWVYIADNNAGKIQKRQKSNFSYGTAYGSTGWEPSAIAIEHLTATGERGSYIYCAYENSGDPYPYQQGISKIRASDMTLTAQLKGTWPRGGGNYGTFLGNSKFYGIAIHGGSVYAADYNRVYKFDRGLTLGTVLISPTALGANYPTGLTTNGTNIFVSFGYQSAQNSIRRHDMLGSEIERITGLQNWPQNMAWSKGYLHLANANNVGLQRVEKYTIGPLAKVMDFPTRQAAFGLDADGSWYWVAEVSWAGGATRYIEQFTMGQGNITGAGLVVTAGSFETIVGHSGRFHGTVTVDKAGSFGKEIRAGTFRASKGSFIYVAGGSAYFNRAKGTFQAIDMRGTTRAYGPILGSFGSFTRVAPTFLGSYRQKIDLPFVGYGVGATKPTTAIIGNTIYEAMSNNDEVYLQSSVPHDWVGTPPQVELDIIPTATQAGSVTSKWYAFLLGYSIEGGVANTFASYGGHIRMPGSAYKMRDIKLTCGTTLLKNKEYYALRVKRVPVTVGTEVTAEPGLVHVEFIYWAKRLPPGTFYAY